jgi:predicted dehydrogenase
MTDRIRWGILSTATIARNALIPAIQASRNGEVVAIASRSYDKAREVAEAHGIPRAYGSYEDLLADPNVDAIYNPLPNDLHAEWSIKAADAGKPVLCEKPLTANAAEARRMVDHFAAKKLLLSEAFMYRHHPQTQRVRQLVDDGAIGELRVIEANYSYFMSNPNDITQFKERAGGGLMDVGCYPVSLMRLMTGEEPSKIASFGTLNTYGVDAQVAAVLQFPSGVVGHMDCGIYTYGRKDYELRGSEGRITVDDPFVIPRDRATTIHLWRGDSYEPVTVPPAAEYQLMVEDFGDSLLLGKPPLFPAEDGVHMMQALDTLRTFATAQ